MKLLILLLSLSSLSLSTPTADAKTSDNAVRDTTGKKLRSQAEYYVLPVNRGRGGGLTLTGHNDTCPLFVAQERQEVNLGLPLTFSPVNTSEKTVRLSTDLNIAFSAATICVQSTVWRLGDVDGATGRRYVVSGGVKGNPGLGTVSNWFKIERYGRDYKLVFCPSVCNFCKVVCGDVGVFVENGKRWLGLSASGVPLPVMFRKSYP